MPPLGIGPRGEMWDLLAKYPVAQMHTPADTAGIAESLAAELDRVDKGGRVELGGFDPSPFDRKSECRELAVLLDSVI